MKFKLVYIIHLLILGLFIASIVGGLIKLTDILEATGDNFSFRSVYFTSSLKSTFFLILPVIGIFVKNKIGFISINHYFYFIIFNLFVISYESGIGGFQDFLFLVTLVLLISFILLIMNMDKVFRNYKIKKESLLGVNLISFVVGFCLSLILYLIKKGYY